MAKVSKGNTPNLKALSGFFKNASPKKGQSPLEDGTYQGTIVAANLSTTQTNKPQVDWTLKVISGDREGKTIHKFDLLASQENIDWFLGTLETLGIDAPEDADGVKAAIAEAVGKNVEFTSRTTGDFTNIYINELLDDVEGADDEETEEEEEEESDDEESEDDDDEEEEEEEEVKPKTKKKGKK